VHHSIELFHLPTLMHNSLFFNNMYIFVLCKRLHSTLVESGRQSEDTRYCVNTICPPEHGHVNARNMSRIVV